MAVTMWAVGWRATAVTTLKEAKDYYELNWVEKR